MPSLFPTGTYFTSSLEAEKEYEFKKTYSFDFINNKFLRGSDGRVKKLSIIESYIQWCKKALLTLRYKYAIYDYDYGVDEIDMVNLDNESIELEITRTVEECLKAHPLTKSVQNFEFSWLDDVVMYNFELTYNLGNSTTLLSGTLEMR